MSLMQFLRRAPWVGALLVSITLAALAADPPAMPDHAGMPMGGAGAGAMGAETGAGMGAAMAGKGQVVEHPVTIQVPPQKLIRDDGKVVQFDRELDDGRPVVVNFIYTTCFGICPISSQTFARLQGKLGADAGKVHLVSVSIDPEEDTPPVLRKYAKKYGAGPGWNHYTGSVEASIAVQKAFAVYKGDKMNHDPVTLLRIAPGKPWIRIEGFATAEDLLRTYKRLQAAS